MIFLSILNIILLFGLFKIDQKIYHKNIFSPGALFIYFAFLPALSNLYFSFNQKGFDEIVLGMVSPVFRDYFYVYLALFFTIIGNIITYLGIYVGSNSKNNLFNIFLNKIFLPRHLRNINWPSRKRLNVAFKFGVIVYLLGVIAYGVFLMKIGGLYDLWQELHNRTIVNAGLGYLQTFYNYSIQIGALLLLWVAIKNKNKTFQILLVIMTSIIMGSMGARGPVLIFIFSTIIMYHYTVKRLKKLFNYKSILFSILIPFFIVGMLQFRTNSLAYLSQNTDILISESINSFESGFIARIGRIERDIVILKYFETNDFWRGKSFYGLVYAPIPRSMMPRKPPNDTGMYLRALSLGKRVEPPMPISSLKNNSWPEGNWVGYMNFGFLGFIIFFYLSGLFYGKFYAYVQKKQFPLIPTMIFSIIAVGGPPILSAPGIIKLLMVFFIVSALIIFVYLPFFKSNVK